MEKYTTLSELLYVGLVFEKGRCKSSGVWKMSYRKSLLNHIELLYKIAICMISDSTLEEINSLLQDILTQIKKNSILRLHYPITAHSISIWEKDEWIITYVEKRNDCIGVYNLMVYLLEDLLTELKKTFRKDKKRVSMIITSLHNLPRVSLDASYETLCNLKMDGVSPGEVLEYANLSMDSDAKIRYQQFFNKM